MLTNSTFIPFILCPDLTTKKNIRLLQKSFTLDEHISLFIHLGSTWLFRMYRSWFFFLIAIDQISICFSVCTDLT